MRSGHRGRTPMHREPAEPRAILGSPASARQLQRIAWPFSPMRFAGLWRVLGSPLDRRYPDSGNERKRVLEVPRCATGSVGAGRVLQKLSVPTWPVALFRLLPRNRSGLRSSRSLSSTSQNTSSCACESHRPLTSPRGPSSELLRLHRPPAHLQLLALQLVCDELVSQLLILGSPQPLCD